MSGDRSEELELIIFPGLVTDHRILNHKLDEFLSGEIHEEMNQQLRLKEQSIQLESLNTDVLELLRQDQKIKIL